MDSRIAAIFTAFLYLLMFAIFARAIMSWFPMNPQNPFAQLVRQITDPLIEPVRRIMPRTGMIDLSPMVVMILLFIMINVVDRVSES